VLLQAVLLQAVLLQAVLLMGVPRRLRNSAHVAVVSPL
jgi:hypothetical protein